MHRPSARGRIDGVASTCNDGGSSRRTDGAAQAQAHRRRRLQQVHASTGDDGSSRCTPAPVAAALAQIIVWCCSVLLKNRTEKADPEHIGFMLFVYRSVIETYKTEIPNRIGGLNRMPTPRCQDDYGSLVTSGLSHV